MQFSTYLLGSMPFAWLQLNRSLVKSHIQTQEFSELQQIVSARKHRQTGKHAILRGRTRIATPSILEQIEKSEAATRAKKHPKAKQPPPPTPTPQIAHPP